MIFVTVGAQMPFDRLVRTVDEWAGRRGRADVFAQIGETAWRPRHMRCVPKTDPQQFRAICESADVIVAHAGMGSILTALELGKPILVMPRRGRLRETRNDHQVATAERMSTMGRVTVAWNDRELRLRLDELDGLVRTDAIQGHACDELVQRLRAFVTGPGDRRWTRRPAIGVTRPGNGNGNGHAHTRGRAAARLAETERCFDGVVCFGGEDWWYHNRGHYDMQMMHRLARRVPVLYVNSLGMRDPSVTEGRMFLKRVIRKLRSLSRGLTHVGDRMWVTSVISSPRLRRFAWARSLVRAQVRSAVKSLEMRRPLVWVACPSAYETLPQTGTAGLVYQRTDRFEQFPGVDAKRIGDLDRALKRDADLTVYCSRHLYDTESGCRRAALVDHGVDFDRFVAAAHDGREPIDLTGIPHPRIGFVGGIDSHTFDANLFVQVTQRLPRCSFVLVGGCSLPDGMIDGPNVYRVGQKPYQEVAQYMAACDVLIMPWNQNEWIRACNPVKLKEYLAVGRPVVSTPFPELSPYDGVVCSASDAAAFVREIERALVDPPDPSRLRWRVCNQTWDAKAELVLLHLREAGLIPQGQSPVVEAESARVAVSG